MFLCSMFLCVLSPSGRPHPDCILLLITMSNVFKSLKEQRETRCAPITQNGDGKCN